MGLLRYFFSDVSSLFTKPVLTARKPVLLFCLYPQLLPFAVPLPVKLQVVLVSTGLSISESLTNVHVPLSISVVEVIEKPSKSVTTADWSCFFVSI